MQREIEDFDKQVSELSETHEIPMQRENKWQDRFDEEYPYPDVRGVFEDGDPYKLRRNSIKSFIQSEIDRAVAEERKRIVKKIKEPLRQKFEELYDENYSIEAYQESEHIINLITKEQ